MILEQIKNPALSREQITFFLDQYKKTDIHDEAQRQRLIDCFVNAVFVYDDKIVLTFNYKDGTKTISLDDVNSSDMVGNGPPLGTGKKDFPAPQEGESIFVALRERSLSRRAPWQRKAGRVGKEIPCGVPLSV